MDEGEFDYELEDAGNDLFSGNHSRREALFLPFSESGREAKEKSRETSFDSFRERREIECEMESLPNGMDILGDSCVRLNLP